MDYNMFMVDLGIVVCLGLQAKIIWDLKMRIEKLEAK